MKFSTHTYYMGGGGPGATQKLKVSNFKSTKNFQWNQICKMKEDLEEAVEVGCHHSTWGNHIQWSRMWNGDNTKNIPSFPFIHYSHFM